MLIFCSSDCCSFPIRIKLSQLVPSLLATIIEMMWFVSIDKMEIQPCNQISAVTCANYTRVYVVDSQALRNQVYELKRCLLPLVIYLVHSQHLPLFIIDCQSARMTTSFCLHAKAAVSLLVSAYWGVSETPLDNILLMAHTPTHTVKWF